MITDPARRRSPGVPGRPIVATLPAVHDRVTIRPAQPRDVDDIYRLIVDLATYERAPEQVVGTPEMLARELFGPRPSAEALIAEVDGERVGFALFHGTFSTWECRPGIWLEDLYVPPKHRRLGVGAKLLAELARITVARGCARLEWTALSWNTPALEFYAKLGAQRMSDWCNHRLSGEALARVAGR
jgi:GNAT superfamily N-acetyltransferase